MKDAPPVFTLKLMGPFRLVGPEGRRIEITSRKGMALIAMLATADDGERARGWLQDRLWGSRGAEQASGSLRRELVELRKQLRGGPQPLLASDRQRIWLDLDQVRVDARSDVTPRLGGTGQASREFLEGFDIPGEDAFEDWLREQRIALQRSVEAARAKPAAPPPFLAVEPARAPQGERLLAVLPFENMPPDPEMAYFSDGVSEEILHAIARTSGLRVVARSSSFQFRGPEKTAPNVAAQLGATHVLDGSVQRHGERVRVTAELIECSSQIIVWTSRYDRSRFDLFALQDEIAAMVAGALQLVFAPAIAAPAVDADARDDFLRARSQALLLPKADETIALLRGVVARAPGFAAAWATLSMTLAISARDVKTPDALAARREEAINAAGRATRLDPTAAMPLVARSLVEPFNKFALRQALLDDALDRAPADSSILKHASDFACSVGRSCDAYDLIRRARSIDPLHDAIALAEADRLGEIGRVQEAYEAYAAVWSRWPGFGWAVLAPLLIAANRAEWDVAEPLIAQATHLASREGAFQANCGFALGTVRLLQGPREVLREVMMATVERQLARSGFVDLRVPGFLFNAGFADEAFSAVQRSSFQYGPGRAAERIFLDGVIFGLTDAPMRKDPRFVAFCGRLGLCDYWISSGRWPDCMEEVSPFYDFEAEVRAYVRAGGDRRG